MFDLGEIMGSLKGVAVNQLGVQPVLNYIKQNWGVPGKAIDMGVQVVGGLNMLMAMNPVDWRALG